MLDSLHNELIRNTEVCQAIHTYQAQLHLAILEHKYNTNLLLLGAFIFLEISFNQSLPQNDIVKVTFHLNLLLVIYTKRVCGTVESVILASLVAQSEVLCSCRERPSANPPVVSPSNIKYKSISSLPNN